MNGKVSVKKIIEEELARDEIKLPLAENVAVNLGGLLHKDEINIAELSALVEKDPSLTAKVLNLSNSPLYAGLVKIKTVEQAITRLGIKAVKNFLMTISFRDVFRGGGQYLRSQFTINWRHSLACGICARRVAENSSLAFVSEEAYLLGLLHDIGTISILNTLARLKKKKDSGFELHDELVLEIIYTFHSSIGAKILRKLNFDDKFCSIVETHHDPESFPDQDDPLLNILQVANHLLQKIGISLKPDPNISIVGLPGTGRLGLDPLFISVMEVDLEDMLSNTEKIL